MTVRKENILFFIVNLNLFQVIIYKYGYINKFESFCLFFVLMILPGVPLPLLIVVSNS